MLIGRILRGYFFAIATGVCFAPIHSAHASSKDFAVLSQSINDIQVAPEGSAPRKAGSGEQIQGRFAIISGPDSRGEVEFARDGVIWIGGNSSVSIDPRRREILPIRGALLIQFPRNGARLIRLGTAALSGSGASAIVEYEEGTYAKVIVVSGSVRFFLTNRFGHSRVLRPGQMIVTTPEAASIPEPAHIDLGRLMASSRLLKMAADTAPVPAARSVRHAIQRQSDRKTATRLIETNLWINGRGTDLVIDQPVPPGEPDTLPVADLPSLAANENPPLEADAPIVADASIVQNSADPSEAMTDQDSPFVFSLQAFSVQ